MNGSLRSGCLAVWLVSVWCASAPGQWLEQTIELTPGWNSVYFEVDPEPPEADQVFAGAPIAAAWMRSPESSAGIPEGCTNPSDPACTPVFDTGWRVWVPQSDPGHVANNLRVIRGGRAYLIRAEQATTLTVTGQPTGATTRWRQGFTLNGFHVVDDPASTPTFASYLSALSAFDGTQVFRVQPNGVMASVAVTDHIGPGGGYWVRSNADVTYDGPISIDGGSLRGIAYGRGRLEHSITFRNLTSSPRDVTLTTAVSDDAPMGTPGVAGDVPMRWLDYGAGGNVEDIFQWRPLVQETYPLGSFGAADARRVLRVSTQRAGLVTATVDPDDDGVSSQYQSVLVVSDGSGFQRIIPLSAEVLPAAGGTPEGGGITPHAGLYLGSVTVNQVSWVTAGAQVWTNDDPNDPDLVGNPDGDTTALRPTASEIRFPVIVHLSEGGEYKLITDVTLLFQPGEPGMPPDVPATPGRFVLATPQCAPEVCDPLQGGSIIDGEPFAWRVSTVGYAFDVCVGGDTPGVSCSSDGDCAAGICGPGDLILQGGFASQLTGTITVPGNHRLNPFRHGFHPDHDCDNDGECYDLTRSMTFSVFPEPPPGVINPGYGDSFLAGDYAETITGLHRDPIHVAGRFELTRVSDVTVLNNAQ